MRRITGKTRKVVFEFIGIEKTAAPFGVFAF